MARQRAGGPGPELAEAAALFDRVCRRLNGIGYPNNESIGEALGGIERHVVGTWRSGRSKSGVPLPILLRACRLAGLAIVPSPEMRPDGPQLYELVPLVGLVSYTGAFDGGHAGGPVAGPRAGGAAGASPAPLLVDATNGGRPARALTLLTTLQEPETTTRPIQ